MNARRPRSHPHSVRVRWRATLLRRVGALERHTLALGLVIAALGGVIGLFAWASTSGITLGGRYTFTVILPGSTPPLATGAQIRVAGKIAGAVTSTEPSPTTLRVNAYLDSSYGPLGRGARIHVGVLLGTTLVYLVVYPGDSHHPLPAGTVIPESRVTLSSSLPQALETFDAATRRALARNLTVIGEGWTGRGEQTNTAIADQRLDYQEGTPLLRAAVPEPGVLGRVVQDSATIAHALTGERPDDVAAGTTAAASFWNTLATNGRAASIVARFGGVEQQMLATLPAAQRALGSATQTVRALEPVAQQIAAEDPSFEALFASAPALLEATRRFNAHAPAVLRAIVPVLESLRGPALALPLIVSYGNTFGADIGAYSNEISLFAQGLTAATSYTVNGHPVLRVSGTLGCVGGRDPYPAPGQAAKDRKPCA